MTEHWFYHLENASIESVLPLLLEKSLERGWRCLVRTGAEKISYFDDFLWTYQDSSFLPHGRDDEPQSALQPILLSAAPASSDGADVVLILDGGDVADMSGVSRCIFMINGKNADDVQNARARWTRLKKEEVSLSYYQQDDRGRWTKKA